MMIATRQEVLAVESDLDVEQREAGAAPLVCVLVRIRQ